MPKRRINSAGGLAGDRLLTAALFDGSINTDVFEAWLQQGLLPALPKGAAAVMDNASFHKSERIQDVIEAAGCLLEYLPPCSPDLNPIEHKWAQAKALRRKLACSAEELFKQPCLQSVYCATAIDYHYRTYARGLLLVRKRFEPTETRRRTLLAALHRVEVQLCRVLALKHGRGRAATTPTPLWPSLPAWDNA